MPSRRFPQRLLPRSAGRATGAALLLAAFWLGACASSPAAPPVREPRRPAREPDRALAQELRSFLLDPVESYPRAIDPEHAERLRSAYRDLVERSDVEEARAAAAEMLEVDATLAPAQVLAAQADFVEERLREVVTRLVPVGDQAPGYVASQLLLGRAAETLDVPLSYAAYRAIATRSSLALQRLGELHPRAVEILANRLQEALRTGNLEEAQKNLSFLESWAPSEMVTLEGAQAVAVARGDQAAELAAVKGLASRRPEDRKLLERRVALEMTVGDPSAGLQIAQDLAARHPKDPEATRLLEAARFRWRLSMLPQSVQTVAAKADLNKADFAVLLYWLVPNVRYARPSAGRIATDVLDHPHQEEIVRVVNLGLMDVDPTLHRFSPSAPLRRGPALRVLVRTLSSFGQNLACLGGAKPQGAQSAVCAGAAGCSLLLEGEECLPGEALSGTEAVELIRRALKLLGAS